MKQEERTKILEALAPAIESITDNNIKVIISALLEIISSQQKEIDELKEKLNTNSNNSSKPPSTNLFNANNKPGPKLKKGKRNKGGQPGHKGTHRSLLPEDEVKHIVQHKPPANCSCGGLVSQITLYQRHQVYELPPIKVEVTEHQLFHGCCEQCNMKHHATLPDQVPTGMLGPCFLALIATLTSDYKMSKRDVVRFLTELFNLSICVATVKRAEETVSEALKAPVDVAKEYVKKQSIVNCDETSHAECGKRMWTWVAIANCVAVFLIAKNRTIKVAKELLGETFAGILGSDRYVAYNWVAAISRQVCWAHLIRDFRKISERTEQSKWIGLRLLVYARRMFHAWNKVRDGTLTRDDFKKIMAPIRQGVEALLLEGSRIENSKTKGTCLEILKIKAALWTFVDIIGVEPTNNIAEQTIRKIVIWRKMCFGTWSSNVK